MPGSAPGRTLDNEYGTALHFYRSQKYDYNQLQVAHTECVDTVAQCQ